MRNKYAGDCYVCATHCEKGDGFFERNGRGGWQVRHENCESHHFKKKEDDWKQVKVTIHGSIYKIYLPLDENGVVDKKHFMYRRRIDNLVKSHAEKIAQLSN